MFITQYFQLPNVAKKLTYIVLFTFLIKCKKFGQGSLKIYGLGTLKMQKNKQHKSFLTCKFGIGSKRVYDFPFRQAELVNKVAELGHPF